jgi:hypothetical protein
VGEGGEEKTRQSAGSLECKEALCGEMLKGLESLQDKGSQTSVVVIG